MEIIKYLSIYTLKENAIKIDIKDVKEGDFIHITGYYSYEPEDRYGKPQPWEATKYDSVYKIKIDKKKAEKSNYYEGKEHILYIKSIEKFKKKYENPIIKKDEFQDENIHYKFYKKESILETFEPEEYFYKCDYCNDTVYTNYGWQVTKNRKYIPMKILKNGTYKCYKCLGIGRTLPIISFDLKITSYEQRERLARILRKNSWTVKVENESVIIGMIMKEKIKYTKDMIDSLYKKAGYDLKLKKREKFYNPERSEIIFYYE